MALIRRPLQGVRSNDPVKVQQLMESIAAIGLQVPVCPLESDGTRTGGTGLPLVSHTGASAPALPPLPGLASCIFP